MKSIKICILLTIILISGIFGIVAGISVNNSYDVSFLKSESKKSVPEHKPSYVPEHKPSEDGISIKFDENYWGDDGNGSGKLYVTADWSSNYEWSDAKTQIIVEDSNWVYLTMVSVGDISAEHSFIETIEGDTTYWHYEATVDNKDDGLNQFEFRDNKVYMIMAGMNGTSFQNVKFTTPSKSVINYTNTTGTVKNVTDREVIIDTSWIQDEQIVSDDIYSIDENLELTLKTGSKEIAEENGGDKTGDIDIVDSEITQVTGLKPDVEYNWTIVGTYYNGAKQVELEEILIKFTTKKGIDYIHDTVEISSTENSIIVKLEIINELEQSVNIKFFDGSSKDGNRIELTEVAMIDGESSSEINPDVLSGWVTYEITGLDYNTEYDLYIQIVDNYDEQIGLITTLDVDVLYSWITPLNITLLVITIIIVISLVTLFGVLFLRNR